MKLKITTSIVLITVSIFLAQLAISKLNKSVITKSSCPEEIFPNLNVRKTQATPYKLIIKPWEGRHNVHGIFMLPMEDRTGKLLFLNIPGAGTFCGGAHDVGTYFEGIEAKPGYYFVKTNLRTRTSIWLITKGFSEQLQDSRNWQLINY
jgi:hypothetical protein